MTFTGYSSFDHLEVFRDGPVGWLVNDRPDVRNAMNNAMRDEFAVAWSELDADPEVRVIVHTGNGRDFQTGVDVSEIASDGVGMERYRESMEDFDVHFTSWHQGVWKPVITAVNGICCGGGFHWVADADIVIAACDAQFFDPHVSVGQVVAIEFRMYDGFRFLKKSNGRDGKGSGIAQWKGRLLHLIHAARGFRCSTDAYIDDGGRLCIVIVIIQPCLLYTSDAADDW